MKIRIARYAADHECSQSQVLEDLIKKHLGDATPEDRASYRRALKLSKTRQAAPAPDIDEVKPPRRPKVNQPKPESKPEELATGLKDYINPHLLL